MVALGLTSLDAALDNVLSMVDALRWMAQLGSFILERSLSTMEALLVVVLG